MNLDREDLLFHIWPGWPFIYAYAGTGALAGLAQSPIEYLSTRLPHQHALLPDRLGSVPAPTSPAALTTFLTRGTPSLILRASLRFGCFGQFKRVRDVKRAMGTNSWPRWLDTAAAGGAAGVVEAVTVHRLLHPMDRLPAWKLLLARHPAKLFCCFGTYGFLSTTFHDPERQPPTPFWKCWLFGAAAGGLGSSVVAAGLEGVRGRGLWANALPRGALGVGTLIAVQVTACGEVMKRWNIVGDSQRDAM